MTATHDTPSMSIVFESRGRRACAERALVLQSVGIVHQVFELEHRHILAVPSELAREAAGQIGLYERENRGWPPKLTQMPRLSNGLIGIMVYAALLILVYMMDGAGALSQDWVAAGRVDGRLMRAGEWARSVTALTLHADLPHLIGNLFFGMIFGLFAGQLLGQGRAWALILTAGALGNVANVLVQHPSHRAVGASTAVFAALGVLTAYTWMHRRDSRYKLAYQTAPLVSGLVLLAYFGTGDESTDIVAHLTGFVCGSLAGVAATWWPAAWLRWWRQAFTGLAALGVVAMAWLLQSLRFPG